MLNWLILLSIAVVLAFVVYWFLRRPILSALAASSVVAIGLQIEVRLELGYWDMFWPIAVVTSFSSALLVTSIALLGWHRLRARKKIAG